MSQRILKILGWTTLVLLVLAVGAAAGGGIAYTLLKSRSEFNLAGLPTPDVEPGLVIASVVPGGPAAEAGVARGDILLRLDDQAVDTLVDLMRALQDYTAGDEVTLTVRHGDDERTLPVTLGEHNGQPYLGIVPCMGIWQRGDMMLSVAGVPSGALVVDVTPDSPADEADIQDGDIITAVDDQELSSASDLAAVVAGYAPGDRVTLQISRPDAENEEDRSLSLTVELGQHPDDEERAYLGVEYRAPVVHVSVDGWPIPESGAGGRFDWLPGGDTPPMWLGVEGLEGVLVRRVTEDSPADAAGLQAGDLLTAIDGQAVRSAEELVDLLADHQPGDQLTLTVLSSDDGEERNVQVTLGARPDDEERAYLGIEVGGGIHIRRWNDDGEGWRFEFAPHLEFESPSGLQFQIVPARPENDEADCCGSAI